MKGARRVALGDARSWPPGVVMAVPVRPPVRPVKAWRRDRWAIRADGVPGSGRGVCGVPARCGDPVRPGVDPGAS